MLKRNASRRSGKCTDFESWWKTESSVCHCFWKKCFLTRLFLVRSVTQQRRWRGNEWLLCLIGLCVWCDPPCLKTHPQVRPTHKDYAHWSSPAGRARTVAHMAGIHVFSNLHLEGSPLLSAAWLSSAAESDLLLIPNFSQGWTLCTKAWRSWARDVFPPRTQTALFVALRTWWKYNLFNLIGLTLAIQPLAFRFLVCVCGTFFPSPWKLSSLYQLEWLQKSKEFAFVWSFQSNYLWF